MDKKLKKRQETVIEELTGEHIEVEIDAKSMKIYNSKQVVDHLKKVKVRRTRKIERVIPQINNNNASTALLDTKKGQNNGG